MDTRELLVPRGTRRRSGRPLKSAGGVTVHNTGNTGKGANADANARYQRNSANDAVNGWHWTVDENEAVQSIPNGEIAEHSGKRLGNDTTVAVEICDNADGDIRRATDNGAALAAAILLEQGYSRAVWRENLYQHHDWSGKDCPRDIRAGRPYGWAEFVGKVNAYMGAGASADESGGAQTASAGESGADGGAPAAWKQPTFVYGHILRCGEVGGDVEILQNNLNTLGMVDDDGKPLRVDGNFGPKTEQAVRRFQSESGLRADGLFGEKSTRAMGGVWVSK